MCLIIDCGGIYILKVWIKFEDCRFGGEGEFLIYFEIYKIYLFKMLWKICENMLFNIVNLWYKF